MLTTSVPAGNRTYGGGFFQPSPFQRSIKKKCYTFHDKFAGHLLSISLCALICRSRQSHQCLQSTQSPQSRQSCRVLAPLYIACVPQASSLKPQASSPKPQRIAKNPLLSFPFVSSFAPLPSFHIEYSGRMDWTRSAFLFLPVVSVLASRV